MMLYIDQKEYISALSPISGVRLVVHHNNHMPFPEDEGIDVSPGYKAEIKLRMVGVSLFSHLIKIWIVKTG